MELVSCGETGREGRAAKSRSEASTSRDMKVDFDFDARKPESHGTRRGKTAGL